jgi:adhesin transport system membrane fusion protein
MSTIDPRALEDDTRRSSRVIWIIAGAVGMFLLWASLAWVAEIVRAPGQIVSASRPQIIQNLEGGILAELNVAEGDIVEAGQTLARLQGTNYRAEVEELRDQIAALDIRRMRLEAEVAGKADFVPLLELEERLPEIVASERALLEARTQDYAAQVQGARDIMEQAAAERDLIERMAERDLAPAIELTRARKAFSDAEARYTDAITQTELDRAKEYSEVLAEISARRQALKAAEDRLDRTVLVAPMRGVVNKLSVTTIGGVVRPGEEILQIVPLDDGLTIEARVKPRDIAAVREGQAATIKLSAYDYTIYGTLSATVTLVSADTFKDDRSRSVDGDPHYRVTLAVDPASLKGRARDMEIKPGMQAEVELQTGGKTILTYLMKPLWKSQEALRER